MNPFELLFGPVPYALCAMFKYGIIPREEDFLELTSEQYRSFFETNEYTEEKIFMMVAHDPSVSIGENNEIHCLTETEKKAFMRAVAIIDKYCDGQNFSTDEERLRYAAANLPAPFSEGTKYEACHNMKVVKPVDN